MKNKIFAEFFGTALLLAIVTGSGIMGDVMSSGNAAVALLGNSIATGCGLFVLITLLSPISGAHFNPMVSMMCWRMGLLSKPESYGYVVAQVTGAVFGVWITHLMFGIEILQTSTKPRNGLGVWLSEFLSTLILLFVIRLASKYASEKVALLVAMTVTAGYWFTSSTFFANPVVTIARSLTDTFVGVRPEDVLGFLIAQMTAFLLIDILFRLESK